MNGIRFDDLTRDLASRRGLLKGGVGAALATALAAIGLTGGGDADAARTCRTSGEVCRKNGECCDGACGPKDGTGRRRCGCSVEAACGNTCCPAGQTCVIEARTNGPVCCDSPAAVSCDGVCCDGSCAGEKCATGEPFFCCPAGVTEACAGSCCGIEGCFP